MKENSQNSNQNIISLVYRILGFQTINIEEKENKRTKTDTLIRKQSYLKAR
jgi:hypothetical protein